MNVMETLITGVEQGKPFYINFKKRTMKLNGKFIIREGVINEGYYLPEHEIAFKDLIALLELAYDNYKNSTPTEKSMSNKRCYFKAKEYKNMTDAEMVCGMNRDVARAYLEGSVLCFLLNGQLKIDELFDNKWFWQSKVDTDFIMLKDWF